MTGDLGRMDEYGYVYVHDRIEDIIVCGGNNVVSANEVRYMSLNNE